jgi:hypothetical protein
VTPLGTFAAGLLGLVLVVGACTVGDVSVFGGREGCWDEADERVASLVTGTLRIGDGAPHLDTSDGEAVRLLLNRFDLHADRPVVTLSDPGAFEVAADGEQVTLFGGRGADGALYVCGVDERHAGP